jgi:hypothetical protein
MNNKNPLTRSELLKVLSILAPLTDQRKRLNAAVIEQEVKPSAEELQSIESLAQQYGVRQGLGVCVAWATDRRIPGISRATRELPEKLPGDWRNYQDLGLQTQGTAHVGGEDNPGDKVLDRDLRQIRQLRAQRWNELRRSQEAKAVRRNRGVGLTQPG